MNGRMMITVSMCLLCLIALGGCTAGYKMVPLQPMETDLRPYSSVVFSVESSVTEDVQKEMSDLEELTVSKIKVLNMFQRVELGDGTGAGEGTLIVKATISNIRKVSGFTRFMAGAFAGRASMTIDISYSDALAKKLLGSYSITGESGGTGMSGGTSDAVMKAAEGITKILADNYKR